MFEAIKSGFYVSALSALGALIFFACITPELRARFGKLAIALAIIIPVIAFGSPTLMVYNLIALLIVPVLATRRDLIAPVYLFSYISLPLVNSAMQVGGVYLLTFNASLSLGIGALLALIIRRGKSPPLAMAHHVPFLVFFLVFALASARDTTVTNMMRIWIDLIFQLALPYVVLCLSIRSMADLKLAVAGLAAGAVTLSVIACFEAVRTWPLYRTVWYHFGAQMDVNAGVKLRGGLLRSPGPYPEPVSFGYCLAIGVVAVYAARGMTRTSVGRLILLAVAICGVFAPQSRGAWFGVVAALIAVDAFKSNWSAVTRTVGFIAIGAVAVVAGATVSPRLANLAGFSAEGKGSIDYRRQLFDRGVEEIAKTPILGDSPTRVLEKMSDMRQGEGIVDFVNAYIYVGLISGLVGLVLIVGAWLAATYAGWHSRHQFRGRATDLSFASTGFAAMICILVMLTSTSLSGRNTGLIAVIMGVVAGVASSGKRASRPAVRVNTTPAIAAA